MVKGEADVHAAAEPYLVVSRCDTMNLPKKQQLNTREKNNKIILTLW